MLAVATAQPYCNSMYLNRVLTTCSEVSRFAKNRLSIKPMNSMKRAYWITSVDITLAHGNSEEVYSTYLADDFTLYEYVSYLRALYPNSVFVKIEHEYRFITESDNGHGKVRNPLFDEDFDFTW